MRDTQRGATLVELLVVLVPMSLVAAGAVGFFSAHSRTQLQLDAAVAMEENLRAAMGMVTDTLRTAGCAVPPSNLGDWITWVRGFDNAPLIVSGGGARPAKISIATCAPQPVAVLAAPADVGATTLTLASTDANATIAGVLNTNDKRLIWIGDTQHALVTAVRDNSIDIDTDPTTDGSQGLVRAYLPGTPISRVDVLTFRIVHDRQTGVPWLRIDRHRGTQDAPAEGISDLQIVPLTANQQYQVTLTQQAAAGDVADGAPATLALSSVVRLRN